MPPVPPPQRAPALARWAPNYQTDFPYRQVYRSLAMMERDNGVVLARSRRRRDGHLHLRVVRRRLRRAAQPGALGRPRHSAWTRDTPAKRYCAAPPAAPLPAATLACIIWLTHAPGAACIAA